MRTHSGAPPGFVGPSAPAAPDDDAAHGPSERPDSLGTMPNIAVVVTHPEVYTDLDSDRDTPRVVASLRARDAHAEAVNWHDADVDWTAFDLVLLRSPWDYTQQATEFFAWLGRLEGDAVQVANEPAILRWNSDKTYLADLERAGIPVVPTAYLRSVAELDAALGDAPSEHVVLKPSVSAGSDRTGLFEASDPAAARLGREILAAGGTVMLQPEVPELSEGAEKALYLIDGRLTHAIAKGALLARGGGLIGGVYQEHREIVPTSQAEQDFAARALRAVAEVTGRPLPLYARIDLVDTAEHGIVLLEAELIEPSLNLDLAPEIADVVADAALARVRA